VTEPKPLLRRASNGAIVNLAQVLGRGGEGTVHAVGDSPKHVAKIYVKAPGANKVEKLKLMARGRSKALLGVAAWPVDLLVDDQGVVRGFLMGRIAARQDAHRLYSPKSRRRTFPAADFRFVVRAATNVARAFAQIHAAGHVIGDVNHGNALIGRDGTAVLIDCDSIQVTEQGRTFPCDVGSPLFTPPELQGKRFRGLLRTTNHDCFGLAALLFHFLFQGRHPFAGRYAEGEMPIERAIAESRFAYGARADGLGMSAPPSTLPLETFGSEIAQLFERAFAPPGGAERPAAVEWIEPLRRLEADLAACRRRPRHYHPRRERCCWCVIEESSGAALFDARGAVTPEIDALTAKELWAAIDGAPVPAVYAESPYFVTQQNASDRRRDMVLNAVTGLAGVGVPLGLFFGLLNFMSSSSSGFMWALFLASVAMVGVGLMKDRFPRGRTLLKAEWAMAVEQWRTKSSASPFFRARAELAALRGTLSRLEEQRIMELDRIERHYAPEQRRAYLSGFEIDQAMLVSVSVSQVEALRNRGIRTAEDVLKQDGKLFKFVQSTALGELRSWANQCAASFTFDRRDPRYAAEAEMIEERYRRERQAILDQLRRGPEILAAKREEIENARAEAESRLKRVHETLRRTRGMEKQ
jgi:DNA-binding helix-hairpin-helix protein with protein kinase domain